MNLLPHRNVNRNVFRQYVRILEKGKVYLAIHTTESGVAIDKHYLL